MINACFDPLRKGVSPRPCPASDDCGHSCPRNAVPVLARVARFLLPIIAIEPRVTKPFAFSDCGFSSKKEKVLHLRETMSNESVAALFGGVLTSTTSGC